MTQPDGTAGSDAGGEGKGECSQSYYVCSH